MRVLFRSIGGVWRRGWDSNPRWGSTHASFQDWCLKPLGHPSLGGRAASGTAGQLAKRSSSANLEMPAHDAPPHQFDPFGLAGTDRKSGVEGKCVYVR